MDNMKKIKITIIWLCILVIVIIFNVYRNKDNVKSQLKNEVEIIYDGSENNPMIEGVQ